MTDQVTIRLLGSPEGKGRPRFRVITPRAGKSFASVYTPKETRTYESALALAGKVAMRSRPPMEGPLDVEITAVMPVPASWSNKKRDAALAGTIWPTGKPDADNIMKMLDSLNKIVWADDSQIVHAVIIKRYGESPFLEVKAKPIGLAMNSENIVPNTMDMRADTR